METGHSFALIATQMPKTKETPSSPWKAREVSKVFKGHQSDDQWTFKSKLQTNNSGQRPQVKGGNVV
jgi:hypothetical protein